MLHITHSVFPSDLKTSLSALQSSMFLSTDFSTWCDDIFSNLQQSAAMINNELEMDYSTSSQGSSYFLFRGRSDLILRVRIEIILGRSKKKIMILMVLLKVNFHNVQAL